MGLSANGTTLSGDASCGLLHGRKTKLLTLQSQSSCGT